MKIKDEKVLWKTVLAQIEIKLDAPAQFKTFFTETKLMKIENGIAYVGVPNPFTAEWLKSKYSNLIKNTISFVYGDNLEIEFAIYQKEIPQLSEDELKKTSPIFNVKDGLYGNLSEIIAKAGLNPKYHINNYIVGNSNRIAHAAALAVIERPGEVYNPLFIHGKTGVGKTHLAQAIGRSILEKNPSRKVLYATSEGFLNDMVKGIKSGQTEKFRQRYRPVDVLIIDDIQLISKWVATQTEFFNTFNEMYNAGRQIIFIADRKPDDIQNIESRLKSRMNGGMVVDISPPDFETRLAILERKADISGIHLKRSILEFVARSITENVRELEGALQKIALFNQIKPEGELTLEEVAHIIGKDDKSKKEQVKVPKILKIVAKNFAVSVKDIKGPRRTKDLALARQVCMYILREEFNYKLEEIAKFLGREDHTTVLHGVEKIKNKIMIQEGFSAQISRIIQEINDSANILDEF